MALMPSEIARLVYGYLLETKCEKSANTFLGESPYLTEFSDGVRSGKRYSTTINQKSLLQMLEENSLRKIEFQNNNSDQTYSSSKAISYINRIKTDILELSNIIDKNEYLVNTNTPETSKSDPPQQILVKNTVSPRRKCSTPKRTSLQQPILTTFSQSVSNNCDVNFPVSSSSASVGSQAQNKTGDYAVNKKLMYEELLNCKPLQEKLANKINYKMSSELKNKSESTLLKDSTQDSKTRDFVIGNIETDLLPSDVLNEIIDSILDEPELDKLIETVIVKDNQEFQFNGVSASEISSPISTVKSYPNDTIFEERENYNQQVEKTKTIEELAKTQLQSKISTKGGHLSKYKFQVLRNSQLQLQQMRTNKLATISVGSPLKGNNKILTNESTQPSIHQLKLLSSNSTEMSNVINLSLKQPKLLSTQNKTLLRTRKTITDSQAQSPFTSTSANSRKRKAVESTGESVKAPAITNSNDNLIKAILNTNLELFLGNIHKSNVESFKRP